MPELTNQQKTGMFIDAISAECMEHISPFQMACVAIGEGTKTLDQVAPILMLQNMVEAQVWHTIYKTVVFEQEDCALYRDNLLFYGKHLLKLIAERAARAACGTTSGTPPAERAIAEHRLAEWTKAFTVIAKMFYDLLESFR